MNASVSLAGIGADRFRRTLDVIERGRERGLHHGVQFCVRRQGQTLADLAVGESPDGRPFAPDTLMPWLSAGKPLTAYALLKSISADEADQEQFLQTPVVDLIPEFGVNGKVGITLWHLLTHTAGLAPVATGWPRAAWEDIVGRICSTTIFPEFQPGRDAAYDPQRSWFILGEILRRKDGRPIGELLREQVVARFGMEDCWLAMPAEQHARYGDRIGVTMARDGEGQFKMTDGHSVEKCGAANPGSSWRGPIRELAKFYDALRHDSVAPWMTTRHRKGIFDRTFQHVVDFGLGIIANSNRYGKETVPYGFGRYASDQSYGHGGSQSCIGFADPEHELAVAAVANGMPGDPQHNRRFRDLCSAIYEDLGLASNG